MGLLSINGESHFVLILLSIGVVAGFLMMVGFKTKLSQMIVWILLLSIHNRFPEANHGGDNLFRILMFIMLFLPTHSVYSFDSVLKKINSQHLLVEDNNLNNLTHFSSFSLFWYVQIFMMYGFTFYYKWDPVWFSKFDSVYYAMHLELFTTQIGLWLKNYDWAMKVMSFFAFWLEGAGPILLIIPWKKTILKIVAIVLFVSLHLGIWLTLILGNFPFVFIS